MTNGKGGPEFSWQTIVGVLTAVALVWGAQWTIFQTQFANVEKVASADRAQITELKVQLDKYLMIREHDEYRKGVTTQIDDLLRHIVVLEAAQAKSAHEPVEAQTFQAVSKATDDRVTLLQNSINDINRQIAAALIIIDNNAGMTRKTAPLLPP